MSLTTRSRKDFLFYFFTIFGAAFLGLKSRSILESVIHLGHFIPNKELDVDYVVGVLWACFLGTLLLILPVSVAYRKALLIQWVARCAVTLGAMLFYESLYGLDSYGFFLRASGTWDSLTPMGFGAGTQFIDTLTWIILQLIPHSYHAVKVTFSFIGLASVYLLFRAFNIFMAEKGIRFLHFIGLFPSVLFWTSILGKEPIMLFLISVSLYGTTRFFHTKKPKYLGYTAIGALIASCLRPQIGPILLLPLASTLYFVGCPAQLRKAVKLIVIVMMAISLRFFLIDMGISLETFIDRINSLNDQFSHGGSSQAPVGLKSVLDLLLFIPVGTFSALFRPFLWDVNNAAGRMSALENFFILLLFLVGLRKTRTEFLKNPIWRYSIFTVLTWALFYAPISYGNFGTAVRYRVQILPLFLCLLWNLNRHKSVELTSDNSEKLLGLQLPHPLKTSIDSQNVDAIKDFAH